MLSNLLLLAGLAFVAFLLTRPPPEGSIRTYGDQLRHAGFMLTHGQAGDITTDIAGFRALVAGRDPYPMLGPAMKDLGVDWNIDHRSTHPPTAYLLPAPIAFLPVEQGARIWAWLMLAGIAVSFWAIGATWRAAAGLACLSLLWPPAAFSLAQSTVIWLMGICVGFRYRHRLPAVSGAAIGIAAMAKLFPALMLLLFLLRRQWRALIGFAAVWAVAGVILTVLQPGVWARYLEAGREASAFQLHRVDNASLLVQAFAEYGVFGLWAVAAGCGLLIELRRNEFRSLVAGAPISPQLWWLMSYLCFALLPIAWIYSSLVLIPILWHDRRAAGVQSLLIRLVVIATPLLLSDPWSDSGLLASMTALMGVGLLVDQTPHLLQTLRRRIHVDSTAAELDGFAARGSEPNDRETAKADSID